MASTAASYIPPPPGPSGAPRDGAWYELDTAASASLPYGRSMVRDNFNRLEDSGSIRSERIHAAALRAVRISHAVDKDFDLVTRRPRTKCPPGRARALKLHTCFPFDRLRHHGLHTIAISSP